MARPGNYLHRRKGSKNWWARFRYTGKLAESMGTKLREISLGTADQREAEIRVLPLVAQHKRLLLIHAAGEIPLVEITRPPLPPGEHILPSGQRVVSTGDKLVLMERLVPGGVQVIENRPVIERRVRTENSHIAAALATFPKSKPKGEAQDGEILATWIRQSRIDKYVERNARETYKAFRDATRKTFATATREDGRATCEHMLKSFSWQTVETRIGLVRAAVNLAIKDGKLRGQPFSQVMPERQKGDILKRLPLDENDMKVARENLHKLGDDDQLLWILLAQTGMRLSEPFAIEEEFREDGVRFAIVGTKNEQSERRVPFPDAALPYLPWPRLPRVECGSGDGRPCASPGEPCPSLTLNGHG
ncbi:MAG: tyrosine-type recombinase/integrase [Microvirga sp.]|nr:tyrosine-type recombinase/integrase [Microvirga sp.]